MLLLFAWMDGLVNSSFITLVRLLTGENAIAVENMLIPGHWSHHLEYIKLKVARLRNIPQDGVVRGLLAGFNLPEGYGGILCSACQCFPE